MILLLLKNQSSFQSSPACVVKICHLFSITITASVKASATSVISTTGVVTAAGDVTAAGIVTAPGVVASASIITSPSSSISFWIGLVSIGF